MCAAHNYGTHHHAQRFATSVNSHRSDASKNEMQDICLAPQQMNSSVLSASPVDQDTPCSCTYPPTASGASDPDEHETASSTRSGDLYSLPSLKSARADPSRSPREDTPLCCLFPQCKAPPFGKSEALVAHYKRCHNDNLRASSLYCDYIDCRRQVPFERLKHLRDHLRRAHKEKIEKGRANQIVGFPGDRRCYTCLKRASIGNCGEKCPSCGTPWQTEERQTTPREVK